jgi:uncharacterized cupin superfamily protein
LGKRKGLGAMLEIRDLHGHEYDVERGPVKLLNLGRGLGAELLGATLFEVQAGTTGLYHLHHANEEWLVVLEGTPTLRTPTEERELRPGQTAVFRRGPAGAHAISNFSGEPARWIVFSTMNHPEVGEYPDAGVIGVIVGDAPTPGRDAPFEGFFPRGSGLAYDKVVERSTKPGERTWAKRSP